MRVKYTQILLLIEVTRLSDADEEAILVIREDESFKGGIVHEDKSLTGGIPRQKLFW